MSDRPEVIISEEDRPLVEQAIDLAKIRAISGRIIKLSEEAARLSARIQNGTISEREGEEFHKAIAEGYRLSKERLEIFARYLTPAEAE